MSRAVLTFWRLAEEEQEFLSYLESTGEIVAVHTKWQETPEGFCPQPVREFIRSTDASQLALGPKEYVTAIPIEKKLHEGKVMFIYAGMSCPHILYSRGKTHMGRLAQSNLSAYWTYPNEDATALISQEPEFIDWGKAVFRWARRWACRRMEFRGYKYPATKKVEEAVQRGEIQLTN